MKDRRHRGHGAHWIEGRDHASGAGPRCGRGVTQLGRRHHHRRGSGRGPAGRLGCGGCVELPVLRRGARVEVLPDVDPEPARRGGRRGRETSRRTVRRRNRAHVRERLLSREGRPGGGDQASSIPYSIVHATQFFEFLKSIASDATDGDTGRLPPCWSSPSPPPTSRACRGRRGRRAGEWHHRSGRARTVPLRCVHRAGSQGTKRSAQGRGDRARALLPHRGQRTDACSRGRRPAREDTLRRLAARARTPLN